MFMGNTLLIEKCSDWRGFLVLIVFGLVICQCISEEEDDDDSK